MNIKKGISYVAFGFLFTLVNFNLTINSVSICVTPDFIGWLLFFLAFDKLGTYISDKSYMKWIALVMMIITGALWLGGIVKPDLDMDILKTIVTVCSCVYFFILFGVLEKIADDYHSAQKSTLGFLKYFNILISLGFVVTALIGGMMQSELILGLSAVIGIVALVAAIVTAVVLFKLRKELNAA
ncbi:MAG: hypothetical protein IIZ74_00480 [Erysipelotrichaceae bacterium]|nr:hypothetical protein [Erysipelotrichaceae bacterium]